MKTEKYFEMFGVKIPKVKLTKKEQKEYDEMFPEPKTFEGCIDFDENEEGIYDFIQTLPKVRIRNLIYYDCIFLCDYDVEMLIKYGKNSTFLEFKYIQEKNDEKQREIISFSVKNKLKNAKIF